MSSHVKFRYSGKATKIWNNLPLFFTLLSIWRQRKMEDSFKKSWGLFSISELWFGTFVLLLVCCTEWINKADFFWSARIDVCFDLTMWFFYKDRRNQEAEGGNCPNILAKLGPKSDPSKDWIIACPPQIFRPSVVFVKTIIVQIDGLTEQGRVNSWPLSWIQKLETAIKREKKMWKRKVSLNYNQSFSIKLLRWEQNLIFGLV